LTGYETVDQSYAQPPKCSSPYSCDIAHMDAPAQKIGIMIASVTFKVPATPHRVLKIWSEALFNSSKVGRDYLILNGQIS